jgi:hypothetical protein
VVVVLVVVVIVFVVIIVTAFATCLHSYFSTSPLSANCPGPWNGFIRSH